jgi:predicted membrane protein
VLCFLFCLSSSFLLCMVVSNTYCVVLWFCLSLSFLLFMVASNTYCVVFFVLFVFVFSLYTREKTKKNKTKNTTQYVLDATIHKRKDEDKQNHNTHIVLCCVFCFVCLRRLVYPMSASFSGLSIFDCLFG